MFKATTMEGNEPAARSNLTRWIMLAVLGWGMLLALGTYLFGGNHPELRAAVVAGCTLGFLGLWWSALALSRRGSDSEGQTPKA